MINLIDVFVGEVVVNNTGDEFIITNLRAPGIYTFQRWNLYNMMTWYGDLYEETWEGVKESFILKKGIGALTENDILEGDDWICHDGRCYPSVVERGGCEFCQYYKMGSRQKKYYEPGDLVWVKSKREIEEIVETSLFITKSTTPIKVCNLGFVSSNMEFSVRFRTKEGTHYRWDELLEVKRKRHAINPHQLRYICEELCWYEDKNCDKCETGKYIKQYNDLSRNYNRI